MVYIFKYIYIKTNLIYHLINIIYLTSSFICLTALRIYPEIFVNMDNYMHDTSEDEFSDPETKNNLRGKYSV